MGTEKNIPLAHSPRPKKDIPAQTYLDHIIDVRDMAVKNAQNAVNFFSGDKEAFIERVDAAALYHDLGKLDDANQNILQRESKTPLPVAHEDAGVAELDKLGYQEATVIVHGHHAGLFSRQSEIGKQGRPFRELIRLTLDGDKVADHVDRNLPVYENLHAKAGCPLLPKAKVSSTLDNRGLNRRIALSCLVDADYGDTARHYRNESTIPIINPRWQERLEALKNYVDKLPRGKTDREKNRNLLRKQMFESCCNAPLSPSIRLCDAPVGSGKTTAIMAHLLRVAAERKPALRHIIVVLPYTNIITQSVEIYRKALTLSGERPENIVAEHHHRADFEELDLRQLATLWKAPVIVTTAVQFFETLGSNHPARLRKLHELPGSAVFVDEMHSAMPSHLWPQMWRWLETWTRDWGGYLILASGSLPRFWELNEYNQLILKEKQVLKTTVPNLITDESLCRDLRQAEELRIRYRRRQESEAALNCKNLIEFVVGKSPGPRLLIVNTVQTAAVIARAMREAGQNVLHLSTSLAPAHRDLIIERVKLRLAEHVDDWTLVATSCVEAGMNFSFRIGFRERASTASLIQIGGRVSRGDEFSNAEVWDVLLLDDQFSGNPAMMISRRALDNFTLEELNSLHATELATYAMKREWTSGAEEKAKQLIACEEEMEYPSVSKHCQLIDAETRTVIIDKSLAEAVRRGDRISRTELMKYSVQIWARKIEKLGLEPLGYCSSDSGLYEWRYDYDPDFLGYMAGVLKIEDFISSGGAII